MSASSYTHGQTPEKGTGGYTLSVDKFNANSVLTLRGEVPFYGFLIYINKGGRFENLSSNLHQYKRDCDNMRGFHRTVTHVNPDEKEFVQLDLMFDQTAFDKIWDDCEIDAVIMEEFQKWFWIKQSCADLFGAVLGPAPATEEF
jgi:hypothetical protein